MSIFNIYTKTITIGLDNASNITKAIEIIKRTFTPIFDDIFHVRCSCHILNLMVQDGLKYFDESVEKVRFAIVYIFGNKTKSRLSYFKEQCKLVDLKYRKIP